MYLKGVVEPNGEGKTAMNLEPEITVLYFSSAMYYLGILG